MTHQQPTSTTTFAVHCSNVTRECSHSCCASESCREPKRSMTRNFDFSLQDRPDDPRCGTKSSHSQGAPKGMRVSVMRSMSQYDDRIARSHSNTTNSSTPFASSTHSRNSVVSVDHLVSTRVTTGQRRICSISCMHGNWKVMSSAGLINERGQLIVRFKSCHERLMPERGPEASHIAYEPNGPRLRGNGGLLPDR